MIDQTKLDKVLDLLKTTRQQDNRLRLKVAPSQDNPEWKDRILYLSIREQLLEELLRKVEAIRHGSENPNRGTDFLRADGSPKLR